MRNIYKTQEINNALVHSLGLLMLFCVVSHIYNTWDFDFISNSHKDIIMLLAKSNSKHKFIIYLICLINIKIIFIINNLLSSFFLIPTLLGFTNTYVLLLCANNKIKYKKLKVLYIIIILIQSLLVVLIPFTLGGFVVAKMNFTLTIYIMHIYVLSIYGPSIYIFSIFGQIFNKYLNSINEKKIKIDYKWNNKFALEIVNIWSILIKLIILNISYFYPNYLLPTLIIIILILIFYYNHNNNNYFYNLILISFLVGFISNYSNSVSLISKEILNLNIDFMDKINKWFIDFKFNIRHLFINNAFRPLYFNPEDMNNTNNNNNNNSNNNSNTSNNNNRTNSNNTWIPPTTLPEIEPSINRSVIPSITNMHSSYDTLNEELRSGLLNQRPTHRPYIPLSSRTEINPFNNDQYLINIPINEPGYWEANIPQGFMRNFLMSIYGELRPGIFYSVPLRLLDNTSESLPRTNTLDQIPSYIRIPPYHHPGEFFPRPSGYYINTGPIINYMVNNNIPIFPITESIQNSVEQRPSNDLSLELRRNTLEDSNQENIVPTSNPTTTTITTSTVGDSLNHPILISSPVSSTVYSSSNSFDYYQYINDDSLNITRTPLVRDTSVQNDIGLTTDIPRTPLARENSNEILRRSESFNSLYDLSIPPSPIPELEDNNSIPNSSRPALEDSLTNRRENVSITQDAGTNRSDNESIAVTEPTPVLDGRVSSSTSAFMNRVNINEADRLLERLARQERNNDILERIIRETRVTLDEMRNNRKRLYSERNIDYVSSSESDSEDLILPPKKKKK